MALGLRNLEMRAIYRPPDGMSTNITNVSADGKFVYTGLYEDLSKKFKVDLLFGYVGFHEYHEARPLSQIIEIATDGSGSRVVFEERYWIGHVNTSPTQPHLLSFCHEGPWDKVDQRIWGLDVHTGKAWKIRPTEPGERVGHEYWLADGLTLGFHGATRLGKGQHIFGFIKYDNSDHVEAPFPTPSQHFFSNTRDLVVGDGSAGDPNVYLWRFSSGAFSKPRILCRHRCSFHIQQTHVHPRFSPDGKQVVFTSDRNGYGNVYLAEVPSLDALPEAPERK
jgi:oligogalacturonide lyase